MGGGLGCGQRMASHQQSHGEGFTGADDQPLRPQQLWPPQQTRGSTLDPELPHVPALDIHKLVTSGSQFVICTHSRIVLGVSRHERCISAADPRVRAKSNTTTSTRFGSRPASSRHARGSSTNSSKDNQRAGDPNSAQTARHPGRTEDVVVARSERKRASPELSNTPVAWEECARGSPRRRNALNEVIASVSAPCTSSTVNTRRAAVYWFSVWYIHVVRRPQYATIATLCAYTLGRRWLSRQPGKQYLQPDPHCHTQSVRSCLPFGRHRAWRLRSNWCSQ